MPKLVIKLAAGTNVGLVRGNNEDNFIVSKNLGQAEWLVPQSTEPVTLSKYGSLLVVADGMGGANAGEVASAIAIETIQEMFVPENIEEIIPEGQPEGMENRIKDFLVKVIKTADSNIGKESEINSSTQGMGTTIVLAWILDGKAYIAWCGDSRCYVFNSASGLMRLSKDHSYVQELVDQGKLDPENTFDHPYSNIITRCLGDSNNRATPDFRSYELKNGDVILLCSDGLCGVCRDEEIMEIIKEQEEDMMTCKDRLIEAALSAGGYDNVTVALCRIHDMETVSTEMGNTVFDKPKHTAGKLLLIIFALVALLLIAFYICRTYFPELSLIAG